MFLFSVFALNAQTSKISSFYGLKFGDTRSAVEAGVRSQGKTGEWKFDKSKNMDYYYVRNVELGSIKFDYASFYIKEGKLAMGKFSKTLSVSDLGEDGGYNVEEIRSRYQSNCQETFELMKYNLTSKYGEPSVNTGEKCMWKSVDNQITLQNRSYTGSETWHFFGKTTTYPEYNYVVTVEYSSSNKVMDNF